MIEHTESWHPLCPWETGRAAGYPRCLAPSRRRRTGHGRGHLEVQGRRPGRRRARPDQRRADALRLAGDPRPRKRPPPRPCWGSTGGRTWGCPTAAWSRRSRPGPQLAGVFRRTRPRWIFAPYWIDAHPDHVAATQLIEAARFWSKLTKTDLPGEPHYPERIFYYYCVHLRLIPQPAFVLDISDYWEQKRAAIECYRSQFIEGRPAEPPTLHRPLARPGGRLGLVDRRPLRRGLRQPRAGRPQQHGGLDLKFLTQRRKGAKPQRKRRG